MVAADSEDKTILRLRAAAESSGGVRSEKWWGGMQEGREEWAFKAADEQARDRWVLFLSKLMTAADEFSSAVQGLVDEGKLYDEVKRALKSRYGRRITAAEKGRIRRALQREQAGDGGISGGTGGGKGNAHADGGGSNGTAAIETANVMTP